MTVARIIRREAGENPPSALNDDPFLGKILGARGVRTVDEMAFSLASLPPPDTLVGMDAATRLLADCLNLQRRILIIGDYDADGATSTALAVRALRSLGARHVDYLLPNRFEFGYGLSPEIVTLALSKSPDLIITVDNGIASVAGVEKACEHGIQVLITDHHLPPDVLPSADAIVNPNLDEDTSGCGNLAGVGVIFYVMLALRKKLQQDGWFERQSIAVPNLTELLDLVALGTVADVVSLDAINRVLVEQGLRRIRADKTREGIRALLQVAGRSRTAICASDIGFGIGPRLNAAGRLADMTIGVECLLSENPDQALAYAQTLDDFNQQRRSIESEMREEAEFLLSQDKPKLGEQTPAALCLFEPHWHQGVVGILASRIKDRVHRPVIVFASDDNGQLKGSGRSIPGVHLRDALDSVASANPGLVEKFGGHAMAAGLSLNESRFEEFSAAFQCEIAERLDGVMLDRQWLSDGELSASMFDLHWAQSLRFLAPWGQGFPEPLFDGEFDVVHARLVGEDKRHIKLRLSPAGNESLIIDGIAFNLAEQGLPEGRVRVAYRLDINEFRGERSVQMLVEVIES